MTSAAVEELRDLGEAGWSPFLETYADTIYRAAERAAADADEGRTVAADVLQRFRADWPAILERFLAVAREERADFRVWLAVVARRAAIDCLRARHGRRSVPAEVRRGAPWLKRAWKLGVVEGRAVDEVWEAVRDAPEAPASPGELTLVLAHLERTAPRVDPARSRPSALLEEPRGEPEEAPAGGARAFLGEVLRELPGKDRLLLRLYFLEGSGAESLRRLFGSKTTSQVYNRVHALTTRLRAKLEASGVSMEDLGSARELDLASELETRRGRAE